MREVITNYCLALGSKNPRLPGDRFSMFFDRTCNLMDCCYKTSDAEAWRLVDEMLEGLIDADLGGGV